MKQIKTIKSRLDNNEEFDNKVNTALAEGWTLVKREVINPNTQPPIGTYFSIALYAELERENITERARCCENCKHFTRTLATVSPCDQCNDDYAKWEAET